MRPSTAPVGATRRKEQVIRVHAGAHSFDVPVQQNQTAKWLALAASNRYATEIRSGGSVRVSDPHATAAGLPVCTSIVIEHTGQVVGPATTMEELVRKLQRLGAEAQAEGVRAVLPTVNDGSRRKQRAEGVAEDLTTAAWSSASFSYSSHACHVAAERLERWKTEEHRRAAEAEARRQEEQSKQMEKLSRLLVSDSDDPEVLSRSFDFDSSNVRWAMISADPDVQRRLKRDVQKYYAGLCDLFRTFSGGGAKGAIYSMQKQECLHMLVACRGIDIVKDRKILDKCFDKANAGRGEGADSTTDDRDPDSLCRYEFLEFLLLLADAKHGDETDLARGEKYGPAGAFQKLVTDKLSVLLQKLNAGPVRGALKDRNVQAFLLPLLPDLMRVFEFYAAMDGGAGTKALVSLDEFILILEHSGLLDDASVLSTPAAAAATAQLKSAKASLTAQEVRETFSGVQRDDDGSNLASSQQQAELSFGEFLEAIGRIALAKWADTVGLKYVLEARQGIRPVGNLSQSSGDVFARTERMLLKCLIMWAYLAIADLKEHLGHGLDGPVRYDCAELVRLIGIGIPDVQAAYSSRGLGKSQEAIAAEVAAAAEAEADVTATSGMSLIAAAKPLKPKAAFAFRMPSIKPAHLTPSSGV